MKLCICFGICFSSKWSHLRLTFFLFSNLGLIIAQQTSVHISCFMAGAWHTWCHPISKMCIVGEGPGEPPSALRCLSYLINSFLTDIKQLAKTSRGALSVPLLKSMSEAFWPFSYFNKTLLYKSSWVSKPGPEAKSSSEIMNPTSFTISYHYHERLLLLLLSHFSCVRLCATP